MQTRENPAPWERIASEGGDVKSFEVAVAEWARAMVAPGLAALRRAGRGADRAREPFRRSGARDLKPKVRLIQPFGLP